MARCGKKCEVYSRVVGYHRAISNWNLGKRSEFEDRKPFGFNKRCFEELEDVTEDEERDDNKGSGQEDC